MDVILVILGILGFGAILIAAYVFTVAARNYVSDEHTTANSRIRVQRDPADRRSGRRVEFPLTVNGMLISDDRRHLPDRREALAA